VDRPGAPQSEIRIGHVGVARKNPDFHAIAVLNAILGGTFNSRLNRILREEKGYTYGISSSFDMRRQRGPFVVRTAVETAVTLPSIKEILRIVREFGQSDVETGELGIARDYLVGVFPLRFEAPPGWPARWAAWLRSTCPMTSSTAAAPALPLSLRPMSRRRWRNIRPDELAVVSLVTRPRLSRSCARPAWASGNHPRRPRQ
jgi:hypothetical protein